MYLRKRPTYLAKTELTLTAASFPAQQVKVTIDRTWPLEEIIVVVHATVANALLLQKGYGVLALLKRANLSVNDGVQPRSVVDATGPGLLQFAINEGLNLDRSTMSAVQAVQANNSASGTNTASIQASTVLRIAYRIPLVHPALTGALRIRSMLPIHLHPQDPVLTLDFSSATELCSSVSDPFSSVVVEVILAKRDMPAELAAQIATATNNNPVNWFIPSDLIESTFAIAASQTAVEYRLSVPVPGQYTGLLIHQLQGVATYGTQPKDLSADTSYATATRWRLEAGQSTIREWRNRHLQLENDFSRCAPGAGSFHPFGGTTGIPLDIATGLSNGTAFVSGKTIYSPGNFGGSLGVGQLVQDPASVYLDFLTDGLTDANELGSLLDCNLPARSGLKMEIVTSVTTPSTAGSYIGILGRRLYGDLTQYQRVAQL